MTSLFPPAPSIRCSDADRERTVATLRDESAAGRLTTDELSGRLDRAFAAKTLGDLRALVADLPEGNVNPIAGLVTGVVRTGLGIARVALWIGAGAAALGVVLPIVVGLAVTGNDTAAVAVLGALAVLGVLVWVKAHRRSRPPRA